MTLNNSTNLKYRAIAISHSERRLYETWGNDLGQLRDWITKLGLYFRVDMAYIMNGWDENIVELYDHRLP